jgi:hypothetical protein
MLQHPLHDPALVVPNPVVGQRSCVSGALEAASATVENVRATIVDVLVEAA